MKLLFYINILSGGGAERVVANLSNLFQEEGNNVILVNTYATSNEYEVSKNVKRIYLEDECSKTKSRFIKNIKRIKALKKLENKIYNEDQTQLFIETPYRNAKMIETILSS